MFLKRKEIIILLFLFFTCVFLRFYQIEKRSPFGWDQIDNAWAATRIIVNHQLPLLGFQAKLNTGIYIGPLYYYVLTPFYFLTNLDPSAAGIFAGVTSLVTFFVIFYLIKSLVSFRVALVALFINTVSFAGIMFDRAQGPVNFLPTVSLIIFYALYKIICGQEKSVLLLALALGFSFHLHLTAIFFPLIILFSLPLFPRTREMAKYGIMALPIFLFFLLPSLMAFIQNFAHLTQALNYGQTFYHGFHLRRVIQLTNDAFIQFEPYFTFPFFKPLKFILVPLFILVILFKSVTKEKLVMAYLILLWFLVPWLVLSTYRGEISDYYFVINRFIVLMILSFFLTKLMLAGSFVLKMAVFCLLAYYAVFNVSQFLSVTTNGMKDTRHQALYWTRREVLKTIDEGKKIEFQEGVAESYVYYYYMRLKGKKVY